MQWTRNLQQLGIIWIQQSGIFQIADKADNIGGTR